MTYTKERRKKWENENRKTSHTKVLMAHNPNIGRCWLKKSNLGKAIIKGVKLWTETLSQVRDFRLGPVLIGRVISEDDILSLLILEDGCDCTSQPFPAEDERMEIDNNSEIVIIGSSNDAPMP